MLRQTKPSFFDDRRASGSVITVSISERYESLLLADSFPLPGIFARPLPGNDYCREEIA
jgi:hypothetical protein